MKNIPLFVATITGTLVFVFAVALYFSKASEPKLFDPAQLRSGARHLFTTPTATESGTASESAEPVTMVQVVEFSDFECPACRSVSALKNEITTRFPGRVEFVYRHFPLLSIHPNALAAAQAAEAAAEFEKFWQMHDLLFARQDEWAALSQDEARERFIQYAEEIDIEKDPFTQAFNSDTVKNAVQSDINLGNEIRVSATPTFFVNDKQVSAPEVISTLESLLFE